MALEVHTCAYESNGSETEHVRQSSMSCHPHIQLQLCCNYTLQCNHAPWRCFCFTLVARDTDCPQQTAPDLVRHHNLARSAGVLLRSYNIIYDLVDDIRAAMEGRLVTVEERTELGQAEARCCAHACACPWASGSLRFRVLQWSVVPSKQARRKQGALV